MLHKNTNLKEVKHLFIGAELKSVKDTGEVEGYGAVFGNVDLGKDIIAPGAFKKSLETHAANKTMPSFFFNHQISEPVGDWFKMGEDSKGLANEGKYWIGDGIPKVMQAYRLAKGTSAKGFSIGYTPDPSKTDFDSKTGIRTLRQVGLLEVSIVPFPMNQKAIVTDVKNFILRDDSGKIKSIRDLEEALRETLGLSRSEAKKFIADGASGLGLRDADEDKAAIEQFSTSLDGLLDIFKTK